ncbi:MAG: glycosyltransferase family 4 protein [Chloroflexi bacterium]|nr:glycosyltransferase family 4 protein [Chloroflexota bacterium]
MRILYIADGRSPTAINWISYFIDRGDEIHLVSTYPCDPLPGLKSFNFVPVAFSGAAGGQKGEKSTGFLRSVSTTSIRTKFRQYFGPLTLNSAARRLAPIIAAIQPDLVHAMRIPYEGMLAALASKNTFTPLLISVWGNDLTLHARSTPLMASRTRLALKRASALHTDTRRDIKLAQEWGFPQERPSVILPGAGGIQPEVFYPPTKAVEKPVVINPRGIRTYIRNDTFFKSVPLVLAKLPEARFVCPAMQGEPQAESWVSKLNITAAVDLLPRQTRSEMAGLFRQAQIAVSISEHDGTPNSLLEAMACGCFPIAGDIESLHEWIADGENGLLVPPSDPHSLANAILHSFENPSLRDNALKTNSRMIAEKATYSKVMEKAENYYKAVSLETL